MSERLRSKEVNLRFSIADQLQGGSFLKVTDWELTPVGEVSRTSFAGEDEGDIDSDHDGFDFSFTLHELDASALAFKALCVFNHENHIAPPEVTLTVIYGYRNGRPVSETYYKCQMRVAGTSGSGKEYVTTKIEGKGKKYSAASALAL